MKMSKGTEGLEITKIAIGISNDLKILDIISTIVLSIGLN